MAVISPAGRKYQRRIRYMNKVDFLYTLPENGIGIELGVGRGGYSLEICRRSPLSKIYGIDRYTDKTHTEEQMKNMLSLLEDEIKTGRYTFLRGTFESHVNSFDDETFDFIFIDGYANSGQENGKTLDDWWPKLKPGGIFSGHDYCDRYYQTKNVVDKFINIHDLELYTIDELTSENDYPSWYTFKNKE